MKSFAWPPANSTPSMRAAEVDHDAVALRRPAARPATRSRAACGALRACARRRPASLPPSGARSWTAERSPMPTSGYTSNTAENSSASGCRRFLPVRFLCRARLDARIAGDAQIVVAHRLVEALLHGVADHVGADLRTVLLRDHLERHMPGSETGDLHGLRELREALLRLRPRSARSGPRRSSAARADRGSQESFACSWESLLSSAAA